jgi:hypothetical protein
MTSIKHRKAFRSLHEHRNEALSVVAGVRESLRTRKVRWLVPAPTPEGAIRPESLEPCRTQRGTGVTLLVPHSHHTSSGVMV